MKECPDCSMFNSSNASRCKYCGASLPGGGGGSDSASSSPSLDKKRETPEQKAQREKEEKRKKIITYAGYGVIAAALIGWVVYMQIKKSKEPPPEQDAPAEMMPGDEAMEGDPEAPVKEERAEGVEQALPRLGERVTLDAAALSFRPFPDATVVGAGDAAEPDPSLLFEATSKDGTLNMSFRKLPPPDGDAKLAGEFGAKLQADYILSKGKLVTLPGKKKGKTALGPFVMFEADLDDGLERAYFINTGDGLLQMRFSYPSRDKKVQRNEAIIDEIFASIEQTKASSDTQEGPGDAAGSGAKEDTGKKAKEETTPAKAKPDKSASEDKAPKPKAGKKAPVE